MRRTIFVFAVVASLLMIACSANAGVFDSLEALFDGVTGTVKDIQSLFIQGGALSSFKLSSALGLFDDEVEEKKNYGKDIDVLHEQSLKEYKDIESIRALAKAAGEKATKSSELTQIINFIVSRAETGKAQISEIGKQRKTIQTSIKEADAAKKGFEAKESELAAMLLKVVTAVPTVSAAASAAVSAPESSPVTVAIIELLTRGVSIGADMYSSFKKFVKAGTKTKKAFEEAKRASRTIKQYLNESQELQKSLNPQS